MGRSLVVVVMALCVTVGVPAVAQATNPGLNGDRLAFARSPDTMSTRQIWGLQFGSPQVNLSADAGDDLYPDWSPDGSKLAYGHYDPGAVAADIWVMNADGSVQRDITNHPASDIMPAWSPDATKIAFASSRGAGNDSDIVVMNADGSNQVDITNTPSNGEYKPTWSPDGKRIAFERVLPVNESEIFVMNADGSGETNITNNNMSDDRAPNWSPDGTKIAFGAFRAPANNYEIYTMTPTGATVTNISLNAAPDGSPAWSPDGKRIVFVRNDGPPVGGQVSTHIWAMDPDGSDQVQLTPSPPNFFYSGPVWRPIQPATTPTSTGGASNTTTTTSTPSTTPLPVVPVPPGSPASGITGCARTATVPTNGSFKLCDATNPPTASTTQTLAPTSSAAAAKRKKKARTPRTVGRGSTTIPSGQTRPITLKLSAAGKRLLTAKRSLTVSATIVAIGPTGISETVKRTVTLKAAKRKRARR